MTQPVLGICLGMQLLFASSEEEQTRCLGVIDAEVRRFPASPDLPVPQMGWNELEPVGESPLLAGVAERRLCLLRAQLRGAARPVHARRHRLTACRSRPSSSRATSSARSFTRSARRAAAAQILDNFLKIVCN